MFVEYGDDSVAQLGGVHLACEQSSQLLAKALEWGRLAAYLEQSTRYMRYDDKPGGRWRATVPSELEHTPLADTYAGFLDDAFTTYGELYERLEPWFKERFPKQPDDTDFVYRQTMLAKTCDTLRMLLPAGTRSNLGIYATGQSYEQLLMRLAQHPLAEMRDYGELMLVELRAVIPEFMKRVDQPERGIAWSDHWKAVRERTDELAAKLVGDVDPEARGLVNLVDHDPEGELKVTAAVLYAHSALPDDQLLDVVRAMTDQERAEILATSLGERENRRHKPGRAWERTQYRFDVLCDYGAYRDLQRHRPLTLEWQRLTPAFGYDVPEAIVEAGLADRWDRVMARSRETLRSDRGRGAPRRRAVRGLDGLPDPVRDADDGARGDASHRAPIPARRASRLSSGRAGDAPADPGRAPRDRRRVHAHLLRGRRSGAARGRAPHRAQARREARLKRRSGGPILGACAPPFPNDRTAAARCSRPRSSWSRPA